MNYMIYCTIYRSSHKINWQGETAIGKVRQQRYCSTEMAEVKSVCVTVVVLPQTTIKYKENERILW